MERWARSALVALLANIVFVHGACHAQQSSLTSPEAISALRQRAATGELAAIHDLGTRLHDDADRSNDAEGRDLLIRAGNMGYPNSASYLAKAYLYGWYEWSRMDGKANLREGLRWLRLAGENARPDTLAQDDYRMLGDLYSGFRIRGIDSGELPVDLAEAIKWYRLCAVEFETFCEGRLGEVLLESPETAVEGFKWLQAAADAGNMWSMSRMADLYAAGHVVRKDLTLALIWYERSRRWNPRAGGDATALYDESEFRIAEVSKLLTPQEVAYAMTEAGKFKPSHRN